MDKRKSTEWDSSSKEVTDESVPEEAPGKQQQILEGKPIEIVKKNERAEE